MNKTELKTKFTNYLNDCGENQRNLELTVNTFTNDVFDMFLNWLESYRNGFDKSYKKVFLYAVIPLMREKLDIFWNHNFEDETYKRYESLFINFMDFANKNKEYINDIMFDGREEKLENLVGWPYWKHFDKKAFLEAWHDYINKDTWKNWDKHRKYLADIYWYLSNEELNSLYDVFFNSYEICSGSNRENKKNKLEENYEKKDAFGKAFSGLEKGLKEKQIKYSWEKLTELKSLFWKYLNFIPKYRDKIFGAIDRDTEWWKVVQEETEERLIDNLSEEERAIIEEETFKIVEDPFDYDENRIVYDNIGWRDSEWANIWTEWDWLWPITVIRRSRNENRWIYDQTERWDIIAPINYWIFPDPEPISEWDVEDAQNGWAESNNWIDKKSEKPAQGIIIHFDDEEKEEEWENPDYTGDYTDSYKNR